MRQQIIEILTAETEPITFANLREKVLEKHALTPGITLKISKTVKQLLKNERIERVKLGYVQTKFSGCAEMPLWGYQLQKKTEQPQQWKNVEFCKPCRTCGKVIGFARTDNNKLMPVNLEDYTTHWPCEKPSKTAEKISKE